MRCALQTSSLLFLIFVSTPALAQFGGSRAGISHGGSVASGAANVGSLAMLSPETAQQFITVDGRAELRLQPTEIRIVMAVTSENETASQCQKSIEATMKQLREAWTKLGIAPKNVVEDFIAVLPVYEWELQKKGNVDLGVEKKTGFRMQSNVHLAVADDAMAMKALTIAFEQGVTDIIGFDYWSNELDKAKMQVRGSAVTAAREKANVLLTALFDEKPQVINVQEQTTIRYPESMYHSFENTAGQSVTPSWRRDVPFLRAYRPKNTYYRGLFVDGDVQAKTLPMRPELSVVSTVRLYFQSPAAASKAARAHKNGD